MSFNPFGAAEKAAKSAVKKVVDPAIREIRKLVSNLEDSVKKEVNSAKKTVEQTVSNAVSEAEKTVRNVKSEVIDEIDEIRDRSLKEIRNVAGEVEDAVLDELPALIETGFHKLTEDVIREALQRGLNTLADVVELFAPTQISMTFGLALSFVVEGEVSITITIPNPVAKLTEIREWQSKPPSGRDEILRCIQDFAPTSISAGFKIVGNGPDCEWDGDDKFERLNSFMGKYM